MSARTDAAEAYTETTDTDDTLLESSGEDADLQENDHDIVQEDPAPAAAASPAAAPTAVHPSNLADLSEQLREAAAEIADIAAQAGRLGITIDAATALREGTAPEVLRRFVLESASAAADARDILAAPPSPVLPKSVESPIVAAAKKAASAGSRG